MDYKKLSQNLKANIKDGQIKITDIFKLVPETYTLCRLYSEASSLSIRNTKVSYDTTKKKVSIIGSTEWTDQLKLDLNISAQDTSEGPIASVCASMPPDHSLSIPGLSWFKLQEASIALETVPMGRPGAILTRGYNHKLLCSLVIDKTKIPLEATYTGLENLILGIGLEAVSFDGISDMARLAGGSQNLSLPAQLDTLGAISLHKLELEIGPGLKNGNVLKRIGFDFGTTKPWELIPGIFTIESIAVNAQLYNPLNNNRNFGGGIAGTLKLGNTEVVLSAVKEGSAAPWTFSARIPEISLSDLVTQALSEFAIDVSLPAINFADTELSITPSLGDYKFQSQSASDTSWKIPLGITTLDIKGLKLACGKQSGKLSGFIEGSAELFGASVVITADLSEQLKISIDVKNISLTQIVDDLLQGVAFPPEIPKVVFDEVKIEIVPSTNELSLMAISTEDWELPLGATGFMIEDISFTLNRMKKEGGKYSTTGSFKGNASLGPVSFELDYIYPGDLVFTTEIPSLDLSPVIQDLCGPDSLIGLPVPSNVINMALTDIKLTASPTKKFLSISSSSVFGKSELVITQTKSKKWAFMAAFAPPEQWNFSSIDSKLAVMDELKFNDTALIISTSPDDLPPISIVKVPQSVSVVKGLTFFASLNMEGLGVDDLMNIKSLTVSTTIGASLESVMLSAAMEGSFKIHENIALGDMSFFLTPAPTNFQLGISGAVLAKIDDSDLRFVGRMLIRPIERSAAFAATMLGNWNEPFGIQGLSIADVAIEVGVGIVPPPAVAAPIVGLAGTIGIGSFDGSGAVKFDTATPSKSMIAASFNQIYLKDVVQTFCDKQVYKSIPAEIRNTILSAGMEDVAVYVVPQPTTIGELFYESGFRFQGKISVADFDAEFMFVLDYSKGFAIKGSMDPIVIEDVFKLTGVDGTPGPSLDIDLRLGNNPHIAIEGLVDLLGIGAMTVIAISDKGFRFEIEGKIFDLFAAGLVARGGNIKNGGDFYLMVEMKNDLIAYLREQAINGIKDATDEATSKIEGAQRGIDTAQAEVNKLNLDIDNMRNTVKVERDRDARNVKNAENVVSSAQKKVNNLQRDIDNMRKTIQAERDRDARNVKGAENVVSSAQNKVNNLQRDIDNMRKTIQAERDRDSKKLKDAQNALANEQRKVNSLQNQINDLNTRISRLKQDISNKQGWYNRSKWYQKSYRWAELGTYTTAKGVEIAGLYTAIGGLETAKATANAALEIAKQTLRGIEAAAKTFPIDADVRIVGLFTAKETANLALEAAKQTLKGLQALIKTFPIDADPRIVALFTALGTATGALQSAKLYLEGVKLTIGGLAKVSSFIAEYGLGGLLDIKRAKFEGELNIVKGGNVAMAIELVLMKKDFAMGIAFNFHDPLKSAELLVKKLLDQIG